jgi:hypothetical protein
MSSSKTLAPPDDALLTALAVEQIATQKRDQTTTQDVKRDVAAQTFPTRLNVGLGNGLNALFCLDARLGERYHEERRGGAVGRVDVFSAEKVKRYAQRL